MGPHTTVNHTYKYGQLDRTSDHPAQGTPRLIALRAALRRSDLRALAHQKKFDLLHPIPIEGRHDRRIIFIGTRVV